MGLPGLEAHPLLGGAVEDKPRSLAGHLQVDAASGCGSGVLLSIREERKLGLGG
jgi:hypothetical protein